MLKTLWNKIPCSDRAAAIVQGIFLAVGLLALASAASAGSIRPAAVLTDPTTEDPGIKPFMRWLNGTTCESVGLPKTCTDAEVKVKNAALTIWPTTQAGLQDYSSTVYANMIHDWLKQGKTIRVSKQLPEAYLAASPAVQSQIDTLAGIQ